MANVGAMGMGNAAAGPDATVDAAPRKLLVSCHAGPAKQGPSQLKPRSSLTCMHFGRSCCMTRMQVLLDKARANSKAADPAKRIPNGSVHDAGTRTAGTHAPVRTQTSKMWLEWLDAKLFTDKADAWLKKAHTQGMQEYKDEVTFYQDVCCLGEMPTKQSPSRLRDLGSRGRAAELQMQAGSHAACRHCWPVSARLCLLSLIRSATGQTRPPGAAVPPRMHS